MSHLADKTKQTKPYENVETELYLSLVLLVQRLNDGVNALLKQADLSQPQYNALRILRGAGPEGRTCNEIAGRMIHRVPDVTRLLDRLESRGLIVREREVADRRVVRVSITKAGLALLAPLDHPLSDLHRQQLACLGEKRSQQLMAMVDEALTVLNSCPGEA